MPIILFLFRRQGSVIATFVLYFSGLDSFQLLLLQDSIEIDKYIGKLAIIGSNSTYNTTIGKLVFVILAVISTWLFLTLYYILYCKVTTAEAHSWEDIVITDVLFSVPASPPLNFTLTPLSTTSIKAEWKQVPENKRNGNITGYIVFYREKALPAEPYKSLATTHLNSTLVGLSTFTEYTLRVLSYNKNGNGLASEEQSVYTAESGI